MKKVKRKYIRKPKPDAPEPISTPLEGESGTISPAGVEVSSDTTQLDKDTQFSYTDLPFSIRTAVESILKYRKAKGLPDDSKERKSIAIKMFRGDRPR